MPSPAFGLGRLVSLLSLCLAASGLSAATATPAKPNIIIIYTDDVGYGDVSCYGSKFATPNIDRLAREGLRFTDAHATSATCTPSRYSLLTGEYAWRKPGTGIARGDATALIAPGRTTLPGILQAAGYTTGAVGKWHLGLGEGKPDWNGDLKPGPLEIGFNYCFLMPATADRTPCVYVENHRVVGLDPKDPITVSFDGPIPGEPTGAKNPELLRLHPSHGHDQAIVNGVSRIGYMSGGKAARWIDEDIADNLTRKATAFIEQNKAKPFFLYLATHDIHVPRMPHARFVNRTTMGPRGDVIAELDWTVGEVLATLDRLNLAENTLVIFSSDNGPVVDDGYKDGAVEKLGSHAPAGPWRGGKYSNFEAGTRVPTIVRWPARVKPAVSDALVCHIDFAATFAALVGQPLKPDDVPDSTNQLATLLGESKTGRTELIEHGTVLSYREGQLKIINVSNGPAVQKNTGTEMGNLKTPQLYDLAADPGEKNNLAEAQPETLKKMLARLQAIRDAGRSRE
jgi:arylsulfatase A-like enzyme